MFGHKALTVWLALVSSIYPAYSAPAIVEERTVADHAVTFQTIFVPPTTYNTPKTLYGRTAQLADGTILATWENYSPEPPLVYFPVFKSVDKGQTWVAFSNVTDQAIGSLPAGTILCVGNSIPEDLSATKIDIYASHDSGATWSFVSNVAIGGEAEPTNGLTPIWEPFLLVYNNQLITYYSDQRDTTYAQKLAHQVSSDGVTWGPVVNDVAYSTYTDRPGMATIAELPNGQWILTHEFCGGPSPTNVGCPIYYRLSSSPLTFNSATGQILGASGYYPSSSPYVVWSPSGGANGTIAVSANSNTQIFINTNLGAANSWVEYSTPQTGAYSRQIRVMDDPDYILIISAGYLGGNNYVTDSVFLLPNL